MKIVNINKISDVFDAKRYFEEIIQTAAEENFLLDLSNATFIKNNYLSIIGMGLKIVQNRKINVEIKKPKDQKVLQSLNKLNFLPLFCDEIQLVDTYKTMVRYTNIPLVNNDLKLQEFYMHFMEQFMGKVENLSPKLQKKILQKIFELFSNVFRHSKSHFGLFCSGQFYSKQNKFNFTIVDNGVTIKKNVNDYLLRDFLQKRSEPDMLKRQKFRPLDGVDAIKWALEDKHSTTGEGGLGLSLLMELIRISKGSIEIVSGDGYYGIKNAKEVSEVLDKPFGGTIISIELNTHSEKYYFLKEEKK